MSNVLLIEPDKLLADVYERTLAAAGCTVQRAISAEQAIQAIDAAKPDAVVISMELPRHNGVEFLYEFRSYSEWQTIPTIVLTSLLSGELLDNSVLRHQLGVEAVLIRSQTKAADLVRAVKRLTRSQEA